MATTHALAGVLVGVAALPLAPGAGTSLLLAGFVGGLAPDLDLYFAHRRTLHFPVYLPVAAGGAAGLALAATTTATLALAVFLAAAALHAVTDLFGGGLELRPWEATSERAVYSHFHGRWLAPRRLVPYDGAPSDLALASVLALPGLLAVEGGGSAGEPLAALVTAALVVSVAYTLVRKRLPTLAESVAALVPERARPYVPDRYLP